MGVACSQTDPSKSRPSNRNRGPGRTLPFFNHDGTTRPSDGDTGVGREAGGVRSKSKRRRRQQAAVLNGEWFLGGGRGGPGSFGGAKKRLERWMRAFGLWYSGAADGAAVASLQQRERGRREARVRVPSLTNGSRADFGIITRGVRDGMGPGGLTSKGFQVADGDGQQRARPLRTDLLRTALRRPRRSKAERWLCSRMTGSSQVFVGSVVGSGDGDGHDIKRHFAQVCSERARGGSHRWRPALM